MIIVDGHVDLAWSALTFGRDYSQSADEIRALESSTIIPTQTGQAMLGYQDWVRGRVGVLFATLFGAPCRHRYGPWDIHCYKDPEGAKQIYERNFEFYDALIQEHHDKFLLITDRHDLIDVTSGWDTPAGDAPRVGLVLLMEGAEAIQHPSEARLWYERGVRMISLSWSGTRYAGGTNEPGPLTPAGRELLEVMAELGMILDLSHLSEEGAHQALDTFPGVIIASHSNPLARVPNINSPERHLPDEVIQEIAAHEGVIGVMLYNPFLQEGWISGQGAQRVGLDEVAACIDHICQLLGSADHVGIGSDLDGGFGLEDSPAGLDSVADLGLIGAALTRRGYATMDVEAILGNNWLRILQRALPG